MAAVSLILSDYLRLLVPEEINSLITGTVGNTRVSLTEILNCKLDGEELDFSESGAKILPFVTKKQAEESVDLEAGPSVIEAIERFYVRENNAETAIDDLGREVETSTFIIREKERFAYSQSKLKGKEILNLYKKNLSIDIEQEKIIKDDLSKSTQSGILVNKKQA